MIQSVVVILFTIFSYCTYAEEIISWGTIKNVYRQNDIISFKVNQCWQSRNYNVSYNEETKEVWAPKVLILCRGNAGENEDTGYTLINITKEEADNLDNVNRRFRGKRLDTWPEGSECTCVRANQDRNVKRVCNNYVMNFSQADNNNFIRGRRVEGYQLEHPDEEKAINVNIRGENSNGDDVSPMVFDSFLPIGCTNQGNANLEQLYDSGFNCENDCNTGTFNLLNSAEQQANGGIYTNGGCENRIFEAFGPGQENNNNNYRYGLIIPTQDFESGNPLTAPKEAATGGKLVIDFNQVTKTDNVLNFKGVSFINIDNSDNIKIYNCRKKPKDLEDINECVPLNLNGEYVGGANSYYRQVYSYSDFDSVIDEELHFVLGGGGMISGLEFEVCTELALKDCGKFNSDECDTQFENALRMEDLDIFYKKCITDEDFRKGCGSCCDTEEEMTASYSVAITSPSAAIPTSPITEPTTPAAKPETPAATTIMEMETTKSGEGVNQEDTSNDGGDTDLTIPLAAALGGAAVLAGVIGFLVYKKLHTVENLATCEGVAQNNSQSKALFNTNMMYQNNETSGYNPIYDTCETL